MPDLLRISRPLTDLRDTPDGARQRQLLLGAEVAVLGESDGWLSVEATADGYRGYITAEAVADGPAPTHQVCTFATHAYEAEEIKSPDLAALPFGAALDVTAERKSFFETPLGYIPKKHLRPLDRPFSDPVTIAQLHFQVPYLWGGNSTRGIDCSGLISAALRACGQTCPGDSGPQRETLGRLLEDDEDVTRGDLIFWKGHVGMMVDEATMIHANAHHMAVRYEPLAGAMARIAAQGDGPVLARKRLTVATD